MNYPLARFEAEPDTDENRRREPRFNAVSDATITNMTGKTASTLLIDISLHGACIRCDAAWLRPGSFVKIAITEDDELDAVVRWVRDGSAGMEFLNPVPANREAWRAMMDAENF
ncbi:PilZ domain-containing protein [Novosphingobium aquimarinum]|uniref:PilZ domain-containing protein n=1 Tax=Novosphingobium aquimarinum TaxID=2682494 RepID=UPI0012EC9051|nr:PilZ domain-containing protein [Novosphingobium aquimarinum]